MCGADRIEILECRHVVSSLHCENDVEEPTFACVKTDKWSACPCLSLFLLLICFCLAYADAQLMQVVGLDTAAVESKCLVREE